MRRGRHKISEGENGVSPLLANAICDFAALYFRPFVLGGGKPYFAGARILAWIANSRSAAVMVDCGRRLVHRWGCRTWRRRNPRPVRIAAGWTHGAGRHHVAAGRNRSNRASWIAAIAATTTWNTPVNSKNQLLGSSYLDAGNIARMTVSEAPLK
jgi:hypothetical protein